MSLYCFSNYCKHLQYSWYLSVLAMCECICCCVFFINVNKLYVHVYVLERAKHSFFALPKPLSCSVMSKICPNQLVSLCAFLCFQQEDRMSNNDCMKAFVDNTTGGASSPSPERSPPLGVLKYDFRVEPKACELFVSLINMPKSMALGLRFPV